MPSADIEATLLRVALTHARLDCDAETVGTFRAILSDCRQGNPRYGRLMWEEGTTRTHGLMERLLQKAVDAGQLEIDDVPRACVQFLTLIKGNLMMRQMFGCADCPQSYAEEIESHRARWRPDVPARLRAALTQTAFFDRPHTRPPAACFVSVALHSDRPLRRDRDAS